MLAELLAVGRDRGELTYEADTTELGEILGALTMDAIESWAVRDDVRLADVLRFRFDLVLERYRPDVTGRT
jgi:hypothetical protein